MPDELNCALLLAAGSGARMQGSVEDKVLAPVQGRPAFTYSIRAFAECKQVATLCIVYRDDAQRQKLLDHLDRSNGPEVIWVQGGGERRDSVLNGLEALPNETACTLIHDCARPLISPDLIRQLIETTQRDGAACLAHPVTDTVKRLPAANALECTSLEDLERDRLWAMETPQAFRHREILKAYRQVQKDGLPVTDDCAAAAAIGLKTTLIHNPSPNPKITTPEDLDYIDWLLGRNPTRYLS